MTHTSTYNSSTTTLSKKIGINGWFLQFPFTGIGQYTIQLLKEFSKITESDSSNSLQFIIAVPNETCITRLQEAGVTLPIQVIPTLPWGGKSIQKHYWEQIQMPRFFENEAFEHTGSDLVWLPYPCVNWFGTKKYQTIITVHDTIPYMMKEYWNGPLSALAHAMSRRSVKKSDAIITVSETSANDIVRVCEVPREKIHVIYNGVSEVFLKKSDDALIEETLEKYGLTAGAYFLYVGGYDPRKRTAELVNSYMQFANKDDDRDDHENDSHDIRPTIPLVLVGNPPVALLQSPNIISTGFLEEPELNTLYDGARAFVHFSQMEGFNIPLAQALIKGIPCGISDTAIHHEIAGDAARYVDPSDQNATKIFWNTVCDEKKYAPYNSETFRQKYSWKKSSTSHLELFRSMQRADTLLP
ncbi:MAG: glycosyltransferase family 1 protein [Candidatus Gracilibacteria bacterium]